MRRPAAGVKCLSIFAALIMIGVVRAGVRRWGGRNGRLGEPVSGLPGKSRTGDRMRIAIVDDDTVEHLILSELGKAENPALEFQGFDALERFIEAGPDRFDHVFLDRCLPPYEDFADTLRHIAEAGYAGHVILMTADATRLDTAEYAFKVTGPINKIDLLNPGKLSDCLADAA